MGGRQFGVEGRGDGARVNISYFDAAGQDSSYKKQMYAKFPPTPSPSQLHSLPRLSYTFAFSSTSHPLLAVLRLLAPHAPAVTCKKTTDMLSEQLDYAIDRVQVRAAHQQDLLFSLHPSVFPIQAKSKYTLLTLYPYFYQAMGAEACIPELEDSVRLTYLKVGHTLPSQLPSQRDLSLILFLHDISSPHETLFCAFC